MFLYSSKIQNWPFFLIFNNWYDCYVSLWIKCGFMRLCKLLHSVFIYFCTNSQTLTELGLFTKKKISLWVSVWTCGTHPCKHLYHLFTLTGKKKKKLLLQRRSLEWAELWDNLWTEGKWWKGKDSNSLPFFLLFICKRLQTNWAFQSSIIGPVNRGGHKWKWLLIVNALLLCELP